MKGKIGIAIALLLLICGCSNRPSSDDQLKRLEELQASPKSSVPASPSPTASVSPSPSIAPASKVSPTP